MNKTTVAQQAKTASFLPLAQGILQRKCACGNRTVAGGECAECAKKKSGLQRKLAIGAGNDPLEREADRVADQVMATPVHSTVSGAPPRIQRYAGQTGADNIAPASVDRVLASSGRPLEPALRQDMEQLFGHDFSRVRVHFSSAAEQSARDVNAHAYTVGHNIAFGAGRFAAGTHEGRRLLAHELTHVVQQDSGGAPLNAIQQKADIEKFAPPVPVDCTKEITPDYSCYDLIAEMSALGFDIRENDSWIKQYDSGETPFDQQAYDTRKRVKIELQKKVNEKERIRAACCKDHEVPGEPPMDEPAPVPQPTQPQLQAPEDKK